MKHLKWLALAILLAALGFTVSEVASARGGHHVQRHHIHGGHIHRQHHGGHHLHRHARIGVFIGVPLGGYWHYPPPYHYYPPVIAVPAPPPVYIERGAPEPAPGPADYWYYCEDAEAYYPYVKECPG
ncbi:MAG: hypothetical protein ACOZCP_14885, partial [Pseudomonadota bacterium]